MVIVVLVMLVVMVIVMLVVLVIVVLVISVPNDGVVTVYKVSSRAYKVKQGFRTMELRHAGN